MERLALLGGTPVLSAFPERRWPILTDADVEFLTEFIQTSELSLTGREGIVAEFEDKVQAYLGAKFALSTSSGTAGLHSAFFGLGLTWGDEVLVPALTYFATVMPLFVCGAVPVLVDSDAETGNIDAKALANRITERTKAIVVTHNFGFPAEMGPIMAIAKAHNLRVVEDCSHAHGATCDDQFVGTIADVGVFSLQSKKLVPAGEGGILVTNDREIYERATMLGHPRQRSHAEVQSPNLAPFAETGFGLKYRIHPFAAAMASKQFDRLDAYIHSRQQNYEHLSGLLDSIRGIDAPVIQPHMTRVVYYTYHALYDQAAMGGLPIETYIAALRAEGVPVDRPAAGPLSRERMFQVADPGLGTYAAPPNRRSYQADDFPEATRYWERCVRLPTYTEDVRPSMERFAEAFRKVADHAAELARVAV